MFSVSGSMLEIYFMLTSPQKQVTNVSLVLKESDTESENLSSLFQLSVSDSQKANSSKAVSFIGMCDRRFVGAARFCAKWGIKLVQATLIPLARSYFPLNCEQADQQIFGLSVKCRA